MGSVVGTLLWGQKVTVKRGSGGVKSGRASSRHAHRPRNSRATQTGQTAAKTHRHGLRRVIESVAGVAAQPLYVVSMVARPRPLDLAALPVARDFTRVLTASLKV